MSRRVGEGVSQACVLHNAARVYVKSKQCAHHYAQWRKEVTQKSPSLLALKAESSRLLLLY